MRSLRFAVAAAALFATTVMASPADPRNGVDYTTLASPQTPQVVGKKVEVIEFFAYHCPACNLMEPYVADFVKKQGANVNFKRIPFPFTGPNDPEAHLFLTLDAMGKSEEFGPKIFRAVHVEKQRLVSDAAILDWVGKSGLDKAKFTEYWNSFGVLTKLRRLPQLVGTYKIDGTPTFVVDGRFVTSPGAVGLANPSIENTQVPAAFNTLLANLVGQVMKEKGWTAAPAPAAAAPAAPAAAPAKKTAAK
jgi:thiol:disulfide interchange protein DsbA